MAKKDKVDKKEKKRKKGADGATLDGEQRASGGKSNLVPSIILAVGLLGGGYFVSKGNAPSPVPAAAAAEAGAEGAAHAPADAAHGEGAEAHGEPALTPWGEPPEPKGPIVEVDPITLNLADGHFLKLGLALHLMEAPHAEEGGHGKAKDAPPLAEGETAKALDETIKLFSKKTMAELSNPDHREAAKEELSLVVAKVYDGKIGKVYFTQFVMQ